MRFFTGGLVAVLVAAALAGTAPASDDPSAPSCLPFAAGFGVSIGNGETIAFADRATYRITRTRTLRVSEDGFRGQILGGLDLGGGRGLAYTSDDRLLGIDRRGYRLHPFRGLVVGVAAGAVLGRTDAGEDAEGFSRLAVRFLADTSVARPVPVPPVRFGDIDAAPTAFDADARAAWVVVGRRLHRVARDGTTSSIPVGGGDGDSDGLVHADGAGGAWWLSPGGTVHVVDAAGRLVRRVSLRGGPGGAVDAALVAAGRLLVFRSRPVGGRRVVELVRVDPRGRIERVADRRRTARAAGEVQVALRRGSGAVLAWREGKRDLVGTLTRPVVAPGPVLALHPRGADTLVLISEQGAIYARVLRGARLGAAVRVAGQCR